MEFIKRVLDIAEHTSELPAVSDCMGTDLSYKEVGQLSGRVYRYLKEHGIGREDFVFIALPRGTEPVAAILGVWRAGAACVVAEENLPPDRAAFIYRDCGCVLTIDQACWREILSCAPLSGYERADDHDAAFAVYTSGSTGDPKGVLHEYGNIDRIWRSVYKNGESLVANKRFALIAPMNFVVFLVGVVTLLECGSRIFVVPLSLAKNPGEMAEVFMTRQMDSVFCAPSMLPFFRNIPTLRAAYVGSEIAHGIWSDDPDLTIYHGYCMSESAFFPMIAKLDKPNTVAPVGRPCFNLNVTLRGENGEPVMDGEEGEICFDNPYVRGYINLPEENAAFAGGEFHTGDMGRKLPDGDYVVTGRKDDMVNLNGNRVEPAEVEEAIKKAAGISWAAVKGFDDGHRSFLAAYHLNDIEMDENSLRELLADKLPSYMIPSYFVKIDAIPRNANGKFSRQKLPAPDTGDYFSDYKAPHDRLEAVIAAAMADVLGIDRVGANADFYLIGGDSLLSMQLLLECGLPGLSLNDIYTGRTPHAIASRYMESDDNCRAGITAANEQSIAVPHRLLPEQKLIFDYECDSPGTTMFHIFDLVRVHSADAGQLAKALNQAVRNHPALLTELRADDDGTVCQHYAPDRFKDIVPEKISDEEFDQLKDQLVQPFDLTDSLLFRFRVFELPSGVYWFFDIHHIVFDAHSSTVLLKDILAALSGEPLSPDYYYYILARREAAQSLPGGKEYFEKRYGETAPVHNIRHDFESSYNQSDGIYLDFQCSPQAYKDFEARTGLGRNALFDTAGLLALAAFEHADTVMINWVFNGRKSPEELKSVGALYAQLPIMLRITEELTLETVFSDIRSQIEKGVQYCDYPYIPLNYPRPVEDDSVCVIYQSDLRNPFLKEESPMECVGIESAYAASQNSLDIEILDDENGQTVFLDYAAGLYKRETILNFGNLLIETAHRIMNTEDISTMRVTQLLEETRKTPVSFVK